MAVTMQALKRASQICSQWFLTLEELNSILCSHFHSSNLKNLINEIIISLKRGICRQYQLPSKVYKFLDLIHFKTQLQILDI